MGSRKIRVLRFIEYIYPDAETMEQDMSRWMLSNPAGARFRMRSTSLPMEILYDEDDALDVKVMSTAEFIRLDPALGLPLNPVIRRFNTLVELQHLNHVHDQEGKCVRNRFGPACVIVDGERI